MRDVQTLLSDYGVSHQDPKNILIHKICVPLIMYSLLGIMWVLPKPSWVAEPWSHIFALGCLVYYFFLSKKVFMFMSVVIVPFLYLLNLAKGQEALVAKTSIVVFILAWIGQFIGHKIEGKKPSFLEDLLFLLIGPIWVFKKFIKIKS